MGKIIVGLWVAVILFGGFWFGYYQEGANEDFVIDIEAKGAAPGVSTPLDAGTVYVTGTKLAFVVKGEQSGKLIVDAKAKQIIIVADAQKTLTRISFDLVDKSECEPAEVQSIMGSEDVKREPDTKTIAGYRCHKFVVNKPEARVTAWFTYELSLGRNHLSLINTLLRLKLPGEQAKGPSGRKCPQVSGFDYFPLPLSLDVQTRGGSFSYTVTSIKHGKVDKKVFEIPGGYSEIKPK